MINITDSVLSKLIYHRIGNKMNDEGVSLSNELITLEGHKYSLLHQFLLRSFESQSEYFQFSHHSDLALNDVYQFCIDIFQKPKQFASSSKKIVKHLYEQSIYPRIKNGDVIVAYFEDIKCDNVITDAVGIFKIERKMNFIKPIEGKSTFDLEIIEGINSQKFDKGCLVFEMDIEEGFKILTIDNNNYDANYWKVNFLNISPKKDDFAYTKNYLTITRKFVEDQLGEDSDISKAQRVQFLNKAIGFFSENDSFDENKFITQVFEDRSLISSFKNFSERLSDNENLNYETRFPISKEAVKKQSKAFNRVIKLDKNFHIYVHGDKELIERGYDSKMKMNYYKIYFDEEI